MNRQIMVRLPESLLAAIDYWRRQELDMPTRSEALRRLAIAALKQTGGKAEAAKKPAEKKGGKR